MSHETSTLRESVVQAQDNRPTTSWGRAPTGTSLALPTQRHLLGEMLANARTQARAEGGAVYVTLGDTLILCLAQNSRVAPDRIDPRANGRDLSISSASPAGLAAAERRAVNVPDVYAQDEGPGCKTHRDFDSTSGYHTTSVLAMPLLCPDGRCVGVMELVNHTGADGRIEAFGAEAVGALETVLVTVAMTIQNAELRDDLERANLDTIIRLSTAAEFREDPAAADHVRRMSHVAGLIAAAMGLPAKQVDLIRFAAPMHDIGKLGIPDAILYKPGRLTPQQRVTIQRHADIGAAILDDPRSELMATARDIALTHHEMWDGTGYPQKLAGQDIPLVGRIAGLADVFDALISPRCYKEPLPTCEVLGIIRAESGKHFDPAVVEAFFTVVEDALECYDALTAG